MNRDSERKNIEQSDKQVEKQIKALTLLASEEPTDTHIIHISDYWKFEHHIIVYSDTCIPV